MNSCESGKLLGHRARIPLAGFLTWGRGGTQTDFMAHIYLLFDFAKDEEKLQQARHKLEGWKQAFRLDKKLLYKMDRVEAAGEEKENAAKAEKKVKKKADDADRKASNADLKLLVRLAFSGHEKLTEQRWVQRIPTEEPFVGASPKVAKSGEAGYEAVERKFEELD